MVFKKGEQNNRDILSEKLPDHASADSKRLYRRLANKSTKLPFVTVAVILCIAICVLSLLFSSVSHKNNQKTILDRSAFPVIYTKEDGLYLKQNTKKPTQVSAFVDSKKALVKAVESPNGRTVYFLENYNEKTNVGALFQLPKKGKKEMIAYNVSPSVVSNEKGTGAAFLQSYSADKKTGTLSLYGATNKLIKVDTDVSENEYAFSENGKYLLYLKNTEKDQKDLILYDGHQKIYVDHGVKQIISVSDDMEVLYYKNVNTQTNNSELYFWNQQNGQQKVADDVYMGYFEKSPDLSMIAFLTGKTEQRVFTLNLFSQKTGRIIVDTNVSSVFKTDLPHKRFLYTKNKNEKNAMGELYVKWGNKDPQKITNAVYNQSQVLCSDDFKTVAYLENYNIQDKSGSLCTRIIAKGEPQDKKIIDQTVGEFSLSKDGTICAYLKKINAKQNGELYYYKDGKRIYVDKNVQNYNFKLVTSKRLYYLKNYQVENSGGELYSVDLSHQMVVQKLEDNVWNNFYFRGNDSILYFRNYNETSQRGDLMFYQKEEPVLLDQGVSSLLFEYSKKY